MDHKACLWNFCFCILQNSSVFLYQNRLFLYLCSLCLKSIRDHYIFIRYILTELTYLQGIVACFSWHILFFIWGLCNLQDRTMYLCFCLCIHRNIFSAVYHCCIMDFLSCQSRINNCGLIFYSHTFLFPALQRIRHYLLWNTTSVIITDQISHIFDQVSTCIDHKGIVIICLNLRLNLSSLFIQKYNRILLKPNSRSIRHILNHQLSGNTACLLLSKINTPGNNISIFIKSLICRLYSPESRRIYPYLRGVLHFRCIICICLGCIYNFHTIYSTLGCTTEVDSYRHLIGQIRNSNDPSCPLTNHLAADLFFYGFTVILWIQRIPHIIRSGNRILDHCRNTTNCNCSFITVQRKSFRKRKITDHQISCNRPFLLIGNRYLIIYLLSYPEFIFYTAIFCCQIWILKTFINRQDCCVYIYFRIISGLRCILCLHISQVNTFHSICILSGCAEKSNRHRYSCRQVWKIQSPSISFRKKLISYRFLTGFIIKFRIQLSRSIFCSGNRLRNTLRNSINRYIFHRIQNQACRHLCIPDCHISGNRSLIFILNNNLILNLLSCLPLIMIGCLFNPETSRIYIYFCIIRFFICIGSFYICHIYTFMAIGRLCSYTVKYKCDRLTVRQIRAIKSKAAFICFHMWFYRPAFISLPCFFIRNRVIYLRLYIQHFHTLGSPWQHKPLRKSDICHTDILCNCSGHRIIHYNSISNSIPYLPFIFICCFVNLQLRAVRPYFGHIFSVFLFPCLRVYKIIRCSSYYIFPFLTIGSFRCLAFKADCYGFSILQSRAGYFPSIFPLPGKSAGICSRTGLCYILSLCQAKAGGNLIYHTYSYSLDIRLCLRNCHRIVYYISYLPLISGNVLLYLKLRRYDSLHPYDFCFLRISASINSLITHGSLIGNQKGISILCQIFRNIKLSFWLPVYFQNKSICLIICKSFFFKAIRLCTADYSLSFHSHIKLFCHILSQTIYYRNLRGIIHCQAVFQYITNHKWFQSVRSSLRLDHILKFFFCFHDKWLFLWCSRCLIPCAAHFAYSFFRCFFHFYTTEAIGSKIKICKALNHLLSFKSFTVAFSGLICICFSGITCPLLLRTGLCNTFFPACIPHIQFFLMRKHQIKIICLEKHIQPAILILRLNSHILRSYIGAVYFQKLIIF